MKLNVIVKIKRKINMDKIIWSNENEATHRGLRLHLSKSQGLWTGYIDYETCIRSAKIRGMKTELIRIAEVMTNKSEKLKEILK